MNKQQKAKITGYIAKVIDDACKSEEHPNDASFSAYLVDNDTLVLFLYTKYARVYYRVLYRLRKNLKKNFGIELGPSKWSGRHKQDWAHDEEKPTFSMDDSRVEAGYCVAQIKEKGHLWFLSLTAIGAKKDKLPNNLNASTYKESWAAFDQMKVCMNKVGGKMFYYENLSTAYENYRADYQKAYGTEAPSVPVEIIHQA